MSTTTTNYGLIKPDTTDPILVGQLNDNADVIDATLKSLSDALDVAKLGIKYKGEVNYYSNLPSSGNQIGDAYTVKYAGSSGTTPDGTEYVWGTVSGTNQWINFSKDSYTKAEVDALLALKQNALTTAQLAAVNSGIDSTKVAQIEINKNNISYLENTGKKNWLKPNTISGVPTGLTVQYESDDSITINGTYSGSEYAYVYLHSFTHEAMQYTLSCNVATSASTFYFFTLDNKMSTNLTPTYIYTENGTTRVVMRIAPNTSFDNVNVKLMIRPSIIADSTYQPCAMSNAELTAKRQTRRLGLWVTSFTVETPPFGTGTIMKVYIYKGAPDKGLSEYILASESVSLVCGGDGVSYSISGSIVTFTTTSTCIAYAETLRFDV